jgi:hypothetical protein
MPTQKHFLAFVMLLSSCGHPRVGGPDSDSDSTDMLEDACAAFCTRAIECTSEEFADAWGFTSTDECTTDCVQFTENHVELHERLECAMIAADMWTCAGAITECAVFDSFEDASYGMPGLFENPCQSELDAFTQECG